MAVNDSAMFKTKSKSAPRHDDLKDAAWGKPCPNCGEVVALGQRLVVRFNQVVHGQCESRLGATGGAVG